MASDHIPPQSDSVRQLAQELGIGIDYWGFDGVLRQVPEETLLAVIRALGHPLEDAEDVDRVRQDREDAIWRRTLPPVAVLRQEQERDILVHVPHGSSVSLSLHLEDGGIRTPEQVEDNSLPREVDGTLRGRARFRLPSGLPLGWHALVADHEGEITTADVVVAPSRIDVHERLGSRRAVGVQAQLYSVRSPRSWGIGDLGDLTDLTSILGARHGADFLLINPLHAGEAVPPVEPSPYLPVTRRFTSPLYLRIEEIPEYATLPEHARQKISLLARDVRVWNDRTDTLERDEVLAAKLAALEELHAAPRSAGRQALLDAFREREGEGLADFALWCALDESSRGRSSGGAHSAEQTTEGPVLPDRGSEEISRAHEALADRVAFHEWMQFVLDEQMGRAQSAALASGMRIGIMHDLAVGVKQDGADAWRLRDVLVQGVGVGAPADQYNQHGQNWDQPPWHPEALAEAGYRPWRDMLRSLMRHAGALRIDHVLGLFRLWWVPQGNLASNGAYVHYDYEALIGILTLEAQRSGTIVIGEDLGTFEPWVREHLSARGILGTSILWFETHGDGSPIPPSSYRRLCLASVNTHDLPPTAGYLAGDHVDLRHELGLLDGTLEDEHRVDAEGRDQFLDALRDAGLLSADASVEDTIVALHRYLGEAPSQLIGVSLVDCVGERRIQNQPGTDEEYPNWRIPLADDEGRAVTVDDIATNARTARLLGALREDGERG